MKTTGKNSYLVKSETYLGIMKNIKIIVLGFATEDTEGAEKKIKY